MGPNRDLVKSVTLVCHEGQLKFAQDEAGLKIKAPAGKPCDYASSFRITGLKLQ